MLRSRQRRLNPAAAPVAGAAPLARGIGCRAVLRAIGVLPLVLEVSLCVNRHRGFVAALLLDWPIVAVLAGAAAGMASGA